MPGESKTSPRRIDARDKQRQALELRRSGATYIQIAKALGYKTPGGSERAVKSALDRITEEPARDVLKLELERLDVALRAIATSVSQGHLGAIDRWIRLSESRRHLLGLDAPVRVNITDEIREMAIAAGFDPDETLKEAAIVASRHHRR